MPKELRRLVLNDTEFKEAMRQFIAAREQIFHGATLLDSRVSRDDPLEVELTVLSKAKQKSTFSLGGAHLAAALINFCMSKKIPLPRVGKKSVKRVPGGIALDIVIRDH